jgi:prolyl-tRNA synthetase
MFSSREQRLETQRNPLTKAEAFDDFFSQVQEVLEVYCRVYEELLAVPVIQGVKSEREKFPGSLSTATVEAFVQGPRGIQGATVRSLGQHFSKAFNITFEDEAGAKKRVWQNSWELSTRAIGIMAMVHGDDRGLVLPPRVAPIQVIVIPTSGASSSSETTNADAADLSQECKSVAHLLQEGGIKSATDPREDCTPGWKNAYWEMKGVPLRIEISARDMENRQVTVARRDLAEGANGHTTVVPKHELLETVRELLDRIQRCLLESARQQRDAAMAVALNWQDFKTVWQRKKMVLAPWCDEVEAEKQVEEKLRRRCKLMLRMPYELDNNTHLSLITRTITTLSADTKCFVTGKPAKSWGLWGRSF